MTLSQYIEAAGVPTAFLQVRTPLWIKVYLEAFY